MLQVYEDIHMQYMSVDLQTQYMSAYEDSATKTDIYIPCISVDENVWTP